MRALERRKIAVIGAGPGGLTAAYVLARAGHDVEVLEAASLVGGLASGFKDKGWEWPLERFYHHWFESDAEIMGLMREFDIQDRVFFPRPISSFWHPDDKKTFAFDSPAAVLSCPYLSWGAKFRLGSVVAYLRKTKNWQNLEKHTANEWLPRFMGQEAYELLWKPMLIAKFGDHYDEVNMAWFWARIASRSPRLGYFVGGFQSFFDIFADHIRQAGGVVRTSSPVERIIPDSSGRLTVICAGARKEYDAVISTTSPALLERMTPDMPESYLSALRSMKSLGAVVYVLALKKPLLEKTYWVNLPATGPSKEKSRIPFLVLVEHTNMIDPSHYGGDHIVYCGDYLPADHPRMTMDQGDLREEFLRALPEFRADFDRSWIRASWLFRTPYAQPIPGVNHSRNIPNLRTPLRGLYLASMSQVYPWDRGTNHAVGIGRRVAELALKDLQNSV